MRGKFDLCIDPDEVRSEILDQFDEALAELLDAHLGGGSVERTEQKDDCITFEYRCESDDASKATAQISMLGLRYGFSPAVLKRHEVPLD